MTQSTLGKTETESGAEAAKSAGQTAARAALRERQGRRLSAPSNRLRREWADCWTDFLQGWTETLKADQSQQVSWRACYRPGQEDNMELSIYADRPPVFWQDMGPFFARRSVRREMPYLVDDDDYVWFLLREAGVVQGFASLHVDSKAVGHLHGLYVIPGRRLNGIADRLIRERLDYLAGRGITQVRTVSNPKSSPMLLKQGFEQISTKGSYLMLEKKLDKNLGVYNESSQ